MHFLGAKIENVDRETARIIKHEFYKHNNNLEAQNWQVREMEAYRTELQKNKIYNLDRITLSFLRISTNYGQNWLLGIFWILGINLFATALSFLLVLSFPCSLNQFFTLFFYIIYPAHSLSIYEAISEKSNALLIGFDLFFRAFNVSLIYLTVSAFRRLSRNK